MTTAHLHICSFFFTDIFLIIIPPSILHMGLEALQFTAVYPPVSIYISVCRDGGMLLPLAIHFKLICFLLFWIHALD